MTRWNGVDLAHAPRIHKLSLWEQINAWLEDVAIPAIVPCMMVGTAAGLYIA